VFRVVLIIILLTPLFAHAELYQWTDENGVKHFSNIPPANDGGAIRQMKEIVGEDKADTNRLQETLELYRQNGDQATANRQQPSRPSQRVAMYTTPTCGYCHRAKAYFDKNGIRFSEYDITKSNKARSQFKALNGRGVPLIVIGDQRIFGFNKAAIDRALGLH
jgi:glutaredoxin-like YruB-family protein